MSNHREDSFNGQIEVLISVQQAERPVDAPKVTIDDLGLDISRLKQFFDWGYDYGITEFKRRLDELPG